MAIKHVATGTPGVLSNFDEIMKDFQDDIANVEEKAKDLSIVIANDTPYAAWVKEKGSKGQKYWYTTQMDILDVRIRALKLPLHNIFNRRFNRNDVIESVVKKLDKDVISKLHNETPVYSRQLSYGTAAADPGKIDKRYPGPYLGWHVVGE